MTIKLVGTTRDDSAVFTQVHQLMSAVEGLAEAYDLLTEQLAKVKGDTDGALLMLEGRIHALENIDIVAGHVVLPTSAKRSVKS